MGVVADGRLDDKDIPYILDEIKEKLGSIEEAIWEIAKAIRKEG